MDLERAHERHTNIATLKEQADTRLRSFKADHEAELKLTKDERIRADKFQEELDRYAAIWLCTFENCTVAQQQCHGLIECLLQISIPSQIFIIAYSCNLRTVSYK